MARAHPPTTQQATAKVISHQASLAIIRTIVQQQDVLHAPVSTRSVHTQSAVITTDQHKKREDSVPKGSEQASKAVPLSAHHTQTVLIMVRVVNLTVAATTTHVATMAATVAATITTVVAATTTVVAMASRAMAIIVIMPAPTMVLTIRMAAMAATVVVAMAAIVVATIITVVVATTTMVATIITAVVATTTVAATITTVAAIVSIAPTMIQMQNTA